MRRRLLPPLLAVVVVACSDGTGPARITGQFLLHTIGGQTLPALVKEERLTYPGSGAPGTRREYVEGMRLVIPAEAADSFLLLKRIDWDLDAGDDPAPAYEVAHAANVIRGDTLCYHFFRMGNFDDLEPRCPSSQVMRRNGNGIALTLAISPPPAIISEYVFVRDDSR